MNTEQAQEIIKEEKKILSEVKKEEKKIGRLVKNAKLMALVAVLSIAAIGGGILYFVSASHRVYIEKSQVAATSINLAPTVAGKLESVYVNEGDAIAANAVVARVGDELIKSKIAGLVIMARSDIGKLVAPGETVVTMIDPNDLRVIGQLEEDKGLSKVSVGERAVFTVDAFGGRKYEGIVDEVSPTSRAGDVVFNISDKRQLKEFNVKIRFDWTQHPELKNGMSAKVWVYRD